MYDYKEDFIEGDGFYFDEKFIEAYFNFLDELKRMRNQQKSKSESNDDFYLNVFDNKFSALLGIIQKVLNEVKSFHILERILV